MKIPNTGFNRIQLLFSEFFGLGKAAAVAAMFVIGLALAVAIFWFFHSAPPRTITITSGPEGSIFRMNAEKYAKILARNGVTLKILDSEGSLENLKRLLDPKSRVDIGFVQGGVATNLDGKNKLVSLGSVLYEPVMIFYRGAKRYELLSEMAGRRISIGEEGSGARALALVLLEANGIKPGGPTPLLGLDSDDAVKALLAGKLDAVLLMGDSASIQNIRTLLRAPGIQLYDFTQADAYTRRIHYLSRLVLPKGSIDFGKNIPDHDVQLIGPTAEIIARPDLHPALSDLLLEAAREVHGGAGLLRKQGEFPAPLEHEFPISADAQRFYKSGKSFLYRYLPFWMASLVNRVLVVFVPLILVIIPGIKLIPALYRWKINLGIYRWYRALLMVERELTRDVSKERKTELFERLDEIEQAVNTMKVPASFAEQFYVLRGHIDFVRERLTGKIQSR